VAGRALREECGVGGATYQVPIEVRQGQALVAGAALR